MDLLPYPNLLLRMPLAAHVVHTAKRKVGMVNSKISIYKENDCLKKKLTLRCQFLWPWMFTCHKTAMTACTQPGWAGIAMHHTQSVAGFCISSFGEGLVSSGDAISKVLRKQFFKGSFWNSWGVGQLQASLKQDTSFRLDACILQLFQRRDVCLDSPSPLHLSGGGGWSSRILYIQEKSL